MLNVGQKVSELRRMTVGDLRREYVEVFGESTRTNHKQYLIKRIVWRMQVLREDGLSERARCRTRARQLGRPHGPRDVCNSWRGMGTVLQLRPPAA